MASATAEAPRVKGEEAKAPDNGKPSADAKGEAAAPASGGLKQWLPLIIAVVTMPALAFATTRFVLLPKLVQATAAPQGKAGAPAKEGGAAEPTAAKGDAKAGGDKVKITVPMNKMLVNVAGTMGTRYLMTSITLVGNTADFKAKVEANQAQLTDLATGTLSSKTIADLEKPGARNVIRSELMTVFNNALGEPMVQEIYITELAIQ